MTRNGSAAPEQGAATGLLPVKFNYIGQTNGIYLATCEKCHKQYVGQTGRKLHERIIKHLRYIKKGINALGEHYKNNTCDSGRDLKFQIIEQVFPNTDPMRLHREKLWIDKLQAKEPNGLNRMA